MWLQLASVRTDVGDFWRPRLTAVLDSPSLSAGLYRFRLRTEKPAYATLRLILDGRSAPMIVVLDRVCDCRYAKSFSVPQPIARIELEVEPHEDARIIIAAELDPLGWHKLLAGRRDVARHLASPRTLALKVRQVLSGRTGLAFATAIRPDPQAIYAAWQVAFEGEAERCRIRGELRRLGGGQPLKLLMVASSTGAEAVPPVPAFEDHSDVGLIILEAGAPSLRAILDTAEQAGAFAFAIVDRPGRWSALAPAMLAVEMLRHPDCMAAYGDSDRLDEAGQRTEPWFKPGWSPRYQIAADYVGSAVAFRVGTALRELSARAGALTVTNRNLLHVLADAGMRSNVVRHVPRVLFHDAIDADRQPQVCGAPSSGAAAVPSRPSVSVIIPSRHNPRLLRKAVRAVLDEPLSDLELIVMDNGSQGGPQLALLDEVRRDPRVRVISDPSPFNFSTLINSGCAASRGEVLLLLNDDVHAQAPGWLAPLIDLAAEARTGCVGALLLYPSGRIQHAGIVLGAFGVAGHAFRHLSPHAPALRGPLGAVREVSAVTAACLAVRRKVFDEAGGFDEALPITLNDVDFCLRVRALGYANLMAPHVRLVHRESASRGLDVTPAQVERLTRETAHFLSKWGPDVLSDPFYSPHLTLTREDGTPRDI